LYNSDEVCHPATDTEEAVMFGWELKVWCDEDVVNEENQNTFEKATYRASDLSSSCIKKMEINHNAGCPVYSALGFVNFLNENVWLSGTLLLVFGLVIGLLGQRWFLPICGLFGAMVAFVAFMVFASIFQWLNTTVGLIICGILAIAAAVATYYVLSNDRIATFFLCIGGGFLLGGVVEGLVIAISGWESFVFYLIITIGFMVAGGFIGYRKKEEIQKYLTACVGAYIFMRGWTFYFGGFPSEMEMYNMMATADSEPLAFTGMFWFYVALWAGSVVLCMYIQDHWEYVKPEESDKDDHHKKVDH